VPPRHRSLAVQQIGVARGSAGSVTASASCHPPRRSARRPSRTLPPADPPVPAENGPSRRQACPPAAPLHLRRTSTSPSRRTPDATPGPAEPLATSLPKSSRKSWARTCPRSRRPFGFLLREVAATDSAAATEMWLVGLVLLVDIRYLPGAWSEVPHRSNHGSFSHPEPRSRLCRACQSRQAISLEERHRPVRRCVQPVVLGECTIGIPRTTLQGHDRCLPSHGLDQVLH